MGSENPGQLGGIFVHLGRTRHVARPDLSTSSVIAGRAQTDRRIIYKRGFIWRHTVEMHMDKVESVDVDQSILGRLLNFGDIIIHGTGETVEPLREIDHPIDFRNHVTAE